MTQEEKLQEAKRLYKTANSDQRYVLESLFPELKESEDERIRKELIKYLKEGVEGYIPAGDRSDYQRWIAWVKKQESVREIVERCKTSWYNEGKIDGMAEGLTDDEKYQQGWHDALEKQGEQKPADKIEPRFKNGQWIVWRDKCYKVNYDGCGYELIDQDGLSTSLEYGTIDENACFWDITKDAKDGDVLVAHECIVLFKEIDGLNIKCYCTYHYMGFNPSFHIDTLQNKTAFNPATKEQRDTLMKAMADAGCEFDFEKKELKKIHVIDEGNSEMDYCFTKMMNSEKVSPILSEEDETGWTNTMIMIKEVASNHYTKDSIKLVVDWLKSLKQRIGG